MSTTLAEMKIGNPSPNVATSGTVRYYTNKDFTGLDGVKYKAGTLDSRNFFLTNTWSVSGGDLIVPALADFPTTSDAQPGTAKITAGIYDGNKRIGILFENYMIPANPSGPLTMLYLESLKHLPTPILSPDTLTRSDFAIMLQQAVDTALGTLNDASNAVKGRTKLSVAPVSSSNPIAVGDNDPRLSGSGFYFLSNYTNLAAAVAEIGSDRATLLIESIAAVSSNLTIPQNISLFFTNEGGIQPANSVTVLIQGPIIADPIKIFYNAAAGQGTIAFASGVSYLDTPNVVQKEFWVEWWGAAGDNDYAKGTANAAALNAAFVALPHGGTMRLAGGFYPIDAGVTVDHKFQSTIKGNDSTAGYSDNFTKPILVYRGPNGGNALTLNNVYSCAFKGFGVYTNDGVNLANGADKGIYLTFTASGYPALTSHCNFEGISIWAVNTRTGWIGFDINNASGVNNEHHTLRDVTILGGGDKTTPSTGIGLRLGHSQVKAIKLYDSNIGNVGIGMDVQGSFRAMGNSFNEAYTVYKFNYALDTIFIKGDDVEHVHRYIETVGHPGASISFENCRVEGIMATGDTSADYIAKLIGEFRFDDCTFLNNDRYNAGGFGHFAFIGPMDGTYPPVEFKHVTLQIGQQTLGQNHLGLETLLATIWKDGRFHQVGGVEYDLGLRNMASPGGDLPARRKTLNLAGRSGAAVAPFSIADGELGIYGIHAVEDFTVTVVGTAGATTRRFSIVGVDSLGRRAFTARPNSEQYVGVTNANATLSGANYLRFDWPSQFPEPTNWQIYEVNPANSFEWRLAATVANAVGSYQTYNLIANPSGSFVARPFLNESAQLALNAQLYFPNEQTFTDGDATPSVGIGNDFVEADTGATNTTTFDDGTVGQIIRVRATTNNRTLVNGATLVTGTGANVTMTAGYIYQFVYRASAWRRVL